MSHRRFSWLALVALVAFAGPAFGAPDAAPTVTNPAPAPLFCPAETATPLELARIIPDPDFLLCTCDNCRAHLYEDCSISPDGYSIACADWLRLHCVK
ncbi:MAG: hypothetical protein SF066_19990 [Thermoanaerobaculia bacterium]|nr:hypothetical protein [Thermoanaerobaculia bacterium]